jgi:hypothetical protein
VTIGPVFASLDLQLLPQQDAADPVPYPDARHRAVHIMIVMNALAMG